MLNSVLAKGDNGALGKHMTHKGGTFLNREEKNKETKKKETLLRALLIRWQL